METVGDGQLDLWATSGSNSTTCGDSISFLHSVQLRSQRSGDDSATNNVRMTCTDGEVLDVEGGEMGEWMSAATCLDGSSISGVRLEIEKDQGAKDDTSVNRIEFMCTRVDLVSG